jgi:hypothetical protein
MESVMSEQTIRRRAASIRQHWTRSERKQRAVASDLRCLDLLVRIATGARCSGSNWPTKSSA